jgi:hypothetical protein
MQRYEDPHAQTADAVQDKGQVWTLSLIPQGSQQTDIPFQAHRKLLEKIFAEAWRNLLNCAWANWQFTRPLYVFA